VIKTYQLKNQEDKKYISVIVKMNCKVRELIKKNYKKMHICNKIIVAKKIIKTIQTYAKIVTPVNILIGRKIHTI